MSPDPFRLLTPEEAEAELDACKDAPPMSEEQVNRIMNEVFERIEEDEKAKARREDSRQLKRLLDEILGVPVPGVAEGEG